jgi:hypothetical protein
MELITECSRCEYGRDYRAGVVVEKKLECDSSGIQRGAISKEE